jgi:hypothetical protein
MHFYSTLDVNNNPDSFFCPQCKEDVVNGLAIEGQPAPKLVKRSIKFSPFHHCQICEVAYQAFFKLTDSKANPPLDCHEIAA